MSEAIKPSAVRPETLGSLKGWAKKVKKFEQVTHAEALELTAKHFGFASFYAARMELSK